ncbi:hypothetical protein AYJ57_18970 [Salipiger sp. CCB-MM3]|nr:hypothetical protein AYJ57_18970 [Salipiger sp. CCB-MM3]
MVICFGYLCGVASKLMIYVQTGAMPPIIVLYAINALVIAVDASLVVRYTRHPGSERDLTLASALRALVAPSQSRRARSGA